MQLHRYTPEHQQHHTLGELCIYTELRMSLTVEEVISEIVSGDFELDSDNDFDGYLGEDERQFVGGAEEDCTVDQVQNIICFSLSKPNELLANCRLHRTAM